MPATVNDAPVFQDTRHGRVYRDAEEMVNDYLARFGQVVGVQLHPLDPQGYTEVTRGSATVGINVLTDHGVLVFLSRIMDIPDPAPDDLFRHLLELNFLATSDAAFAIDRERGAIYLRALRRLTGLDYEEFEDLLHTVATVADEWDDRLAQLYPSAP
ncbi:MAG: YbjN domain-containing protein [Myxococcota bacterium]